MTFPVGVWGRVLRPPASEPHLAEVRIDRDKGDSYIILTREPNGEFDTWVENEEDVLAYLRPMTVDWPSV